MTSLRALRAWIWSAIGAAAMGLTAPASGSSQTLAVSGNPGAMVVSSANAGAAPTAAVESVTTYSVNVPGGTAHILGRLDAPLPAGINLYVSLSSAGGSPIGEVKLTTLDQLLAHATSGIHTGVGIHYRLVASVAAGVIPPSVRGVVLTVVMDP